MRYVLVPFYLTCPNHCLLNGCEYLSWIWVVTFTTCLRSQQGVEAYGVLSDVSLENYSRLTRNEVLTSSPVSPWTPFLDLTGTLQQHWPLFRNGGTLLLSSTMSLWMSFPLSPPISLPRVIDSVPLSCAAIGAEPSFKTAPCGPSYFSERARPT